jgi:broad specificity phosphatase PhoE
MSRIYMVRHGRASAGWDRAVDPSLDEVGREQAGSVARKLAPIGPIKIVSSPLARCRETAAPLAEQWKVGVQVELRVAEIPSPVGYTMESRVDWLREAMRGTWSDLDAPYMAYRDAAYEYVASLPADTVVFSHFVAINAVLGCALDDDRVLIDSLDNCSVTVFETDGLGALRVVDRGHQADTLIR